MNNLGEKINKKRKELGWSLDELARKSNVSKAYLSQLENGDSESPSAKILYNIAMALGTSIADLLGKKLSPVEVDAIPKNLSKAVIEHNIPENYVKILLAVSARTDKDSKKENDLSPDDWFYLY